jgi:hypothetical protein
MGGRVSAYAKMYSSSRWGEVLAAYMEGGSASRPKIAQIIRECIAKEDTCIVLDVTSLYPSAMAYCPMPMGSLSYLSADLCIDAVYSVGCPLCESLMQICPVHRVEKRPFAVILINGGLRRGEGWSEISEANPVRHLIGRKLKGRRERGGCATTVMGGADVGGLVYTNEEDDEMTRRYWGITPKTAGDNILGECQAYTNIDLYWALKCGF